jgi:hypothetical protein
MMLSFDTIKYSGFEPVLIREGLGSGVNKFYFFTGFLLYGGLMIN